MVRATVTYSGIVSWSQQRLRDEAAHVRTLADYCADTQWRDRVADQAAKANDEHQGPGEAE